MTCNLEYSIACWTTLAYVAYVSRASDLSVRPRSLRAGQRRQHDDANDGDRRDREGRAITECFLDLLQARFEDAFSIVTEDQIADLITTEMITRAVDSTFETLKPHLRRGLPELVNGHRRDEAEMAGFLQRIWGAPDTLCRAMIQVAVELHGMKQPHAADATAQALWGLLSRACRTAAEVRHLAMHGFGAAAGARWRSLHEIAVVAAVLSTADDTVAQRYLASATIERLHDVEAYQERATALKRTPHDE